MTTSVSRRLNILVYLNNSVLCNNDVPRYMWGLEFYSHVESPCMTASFH
jgi:hypothetical protein